MESIPIEVYYTLLMKWQSQKVLIWSQTDVPMERQKILGLVKGKLPGDEVEIKSLLGLELGKVKEFMMIGTPEGAELNERIGPAEPVAEEEDYSARESRIAAETAKNNARNQRRLKEATKALTIDIMKPPRIGKKLLVLDLDYAILDTALWKEENFITEHFARPFLHEMLSMLAPYYDFCFWSQTHWRWLEQKLVELEILGENARADYPVVFTLDRAPMFSVYSIRHDKPFKHEVKALQIIWSKFPNQYSASNTIHVDDLQRNFLLNEANGLRVRAYKDAMNSRETDRELVYITRYLLQLVGIEDVTLCDHTKFKEFEGNLPLGEDGIVVEDPVLKMGLKIKKRKAVDNVDAVASSSTSTSASGSGGASGSGTGTGDETGKAAEGAGGKKKE